MHISINSYNYTKYNYHTLRSDNIGFKGCKNNECNVHHRETSPKKIVGYLIGGTLLAGAVGTANLSSGGKGYTGSDSFNDINVEYSHVDRITKDSVMKPVYDLSLHLKKDNDFLRGIRFDIADKFSEIEPDNPFQRYLKEFKTENDIKGVSFYSDSKLPKQVAIQEISHLDLNRKVDYMAMRQTLMHEIGHHFDNFFGHNHSADYAQKWDSLMYSKECPYNFATDTKYDKELDREFNYNNSLSDKKEFQHALIKDLKHIGRLLRRYDTMPKNLDYYIDGFDFYREATANDVNLNNSARAEIYANLFSYAMGEDDGDRELFIRCFENCYNIVKGDIQTFLQIDCQ